jgi:hypothetical protein
MYSYSTIYSVYKVFGFSIQSVRVGPCLEDEQIKAYKSFMTVGLELILGFRESPFVSAFVLFIWLTFIFVPVFGFWYGASIYFKISCDWVLFSPKPLIWVLFSPKPLIWVLCFTLFLLFFTISCSCIFFFSKSKWELKMICAVWH